jgi:hypothetical protein
MGSFKNEWMKIPITNYVTKIEYLGLKVNQLWALGFKLLETTKGGHIEFRIPFT